MAWSAAAWLAGAAVSSAQPPSPQDVVRTLQSGLVELSVEQSGLAFAQRYERLEALVSSTHDLPYIAQFSLGRHWRELTTAQQQDFVALFERLSVMTYASRFGGVSADTFELGGVEDLGNGRAQVESRIKRSQGADVPLDYVLQLRDGQWRIVNIIADGVSDLALKRAQYQQLVSSGSIEELDQNLAEQTAELEANAQRTNR
jgi:phospholipid transport system substrate-binding protein